MKHALIFLLLGLCIMSGIANGKKFLCEKYTLEIELCETSDSNESELTSLHSLFSVIPSHFLFFDPTADLSNNHSSVGSVKAIFLDFFCPPPESR